MSFWTDNINNLVQDHQNEITKHMRRYGVVRPHRNYRWGYRDLRNGYNMFGQPFLNGLGTIITSLWGKNGVLNQSTAASPGIFGGAPLTAVSEGVGDTGYTPVTTLPSYTGELSNATGPDLRRDDRRRHDWFNRYFRGEPVLYPFAYATPWIGLSNGDPLPAPSALPDELPPVDDTIFGINKKLFFVLAGVLALVLYLKFRK